MRMERVELTAVGHEHVRATHASTLELTRDDWLTPAGDCIVGIEADLAPAGFPPEFVDRCRDEDARVTMTLRSGGLLERVRGRGHPDLTFANDRSMVVRTSSFVDDRTVMVNADAAAGDLDRALVRRLQGAAPLRVTITATR